MNAKRNGIRNEWRSMALLGEAYAARLPRELVQLQETAA